MDDFDNGGAGLPDEMTTELPDLEVVEAEVEIDLEGAAMAPAGRKSGGARAGKSGGAHKAAAKAPAAKKKAKPAAKAKAKPAAKKKSKPAKKAAKKAAKRAPKKASAKRKAGQKK